MATGNKNTGKDLAEQPDPVEDVADYAPGQSFAELVTTSDVVDGADLAKDELKLALCGIPFVITRVVFRPGAARKAYVSSELVIADADTLRRRRVNVPDMAFEPEQRVVFNDGSTGVYRQLVQYLEAKGYITLPDMPENGSYGETKYDLPPEQWTEINAGEISFDDDGRGIYTKNVRLSCPRGLRKSEYQNDFNPDGSTTCYLG